MRYTLLLLLFASLNLFGQALPTEFGRDDALSIAQSGSDYVLTVVTTGDEVSGTLTYTFSDSSDVVEYLNELFVRMARRRATWVAGLYDQDFESKRNTYFNLLEQVQTGDDVDSIRNNRLFSRFLVDTVNLRIPVNDIPTEALSNFTSDPGATGVLNLDCRFFFNASGNLRFQIIETGRSFTANIYSRNDLAVNNLLGERVDFTLTDVIPQNSSTRYTWRRATDALSSGGIRINYTIRNNLFLLMLLLLPSFRILAQIHEYDGTGSEAPIVVNEGETLLLRFGSTNLKNKHGSHSDLLDGSNGRINAMSQNDAFLLRVGAEAKPYDNNIESKVSISIRPIDQSFTTPITDDILLSSDSYARIGDEVVFWAGAS
ncbi:MAG: hypothetical protein AAFO91_13255, partial [Bacteroidota bacterium]